MGSVHPGSNFFGKTPLFFRYSGVNAANAVNSSRTQLTPLYRRGTPLTSSVFRLNNVNAVIPEKTCVHKNLIFSLHEEWETHGQSFNWQSIRKSIFPRKCGRTAGDWSLCLNVAALVVSLNLPWLSKFTKKLIILRLD